MKMFDKNFEKYDVPGPIRTVAELISLRFNIKGVCDPMYIANVIAFESGSGDGAGNFTSAEITNIPVIAERLQFAYGCNIGKECIPELEEILRTGKLDKKKALEGLDEIIRTCKRERSSCDAWRKDYLSKCVVNAQKNKKIIDKMEENV